MTASLRILSSKADSNTWERFTRSELKLKSVHQESPCSDIFRKRATKPLLNQRQRQRRLTWAKEKNNWTVAQWSKVLFSVKVNSAFHLEIKVPESGGREERHRIHVSWSSVWSFHTAIYQDILEHVMLPSADKLYGDADFIFQQDLAPAHTVKGTKSWFNDHGVTVLNWPANSPDLNPIENIWAIVKRKMRDTRPNNAEDLKAAIKATWAFITPEQCHRLIDSMPRRIDAVIHAKGSPTKYWVHRN